MRGQRHAPAALYPPGKTRYPLYGRLGGPQGRSEQVRKILPPPGFDPRTVQPVASRYTDWATRLFSGYRGYFRWGAASLWNWLSLTASADVKSVWSCTSATPLWPHGMDRENYTVYLYNNKYVAVRHGPVLTDAFRVNSLRNGSVP